MVPAASAQSCAVGRPLLPPFGWPDDDGEDYTGLHTPAQAVPASDATLLHVEVEQADPQRADPALAGVSVVFSHGYALTMDSWYFQRKALRGRYRLVFWDQRGHGRSGTGPPGSATIDQVGRDLAAVLDEVAPAGPLVLIGHSMGGMTVMALADQRPELFADRVIGVGLVSTSTGKLAEITFGFPAVFSRVNRRVMPVVEQGLARRAEVIERSRRVGTDINFLLTRYFTFGSGDVSPAVVELVERMIVATPLSVITDFFPAFLSLDKLAAMSVLNPVEVVVLVGEKDALTPLEHSRAIAAALPRARLVVLPNSGHMLPVERPAEVTRELRELIERVESRLATGDRAGSGA